MFFAECIGGMYSTKEIVIVSQGCGNNRNNIEYKRWKESHLSIYLFWMMIHQNSGLLLLRKGGFRIL